MVKGSRRPNTEGLPQELKDRGYENRFIEEHLTKQLSVKKDTEIVKSFNYITKFTSRLDHRILRRASCTQAPLISQVAGGKVFLRLSCYHWTDFFSYRNYAHTWQVGVGGRD